MTASRQEQLLAGQDAEMSSDEAEAAAELEFPGSESEDASSEQLPNQLSRHVHTACMHCSQH